MLVGTMPWLANALVSATGTTCSCIPLMAHSGHCSNVLSLHC
jgi:hypothetical protein